MTGSQKSLCAPVDTLQRVGVQQRNVGELVSFVEDGAIHYEYQYSSTEWSSSLWYTRYTWYYIPGTR